MKLEFNRQTLQGFAELFYPLVELTILDLQGKMQETLNTFSTLKEDQDCEVHQLQQLNQVFQELLTMGRDVRCILYPLSEDGILTGYLRLRYDLTHFKNLQEQLQFLVQTTENVSTQNHLDTWKNSIDQLIVRYLSEHKVNLQALSTKHKREMIANLQAKGLLEFKESSAYIASKLQISRATVYNYLKTSSYLKKVQVHQVDAFTHKKFGGNPAGVVLDADELDEIKMRKIARELNLSETAFVFSSDTEDFKMRYFTPTGHEISFCGHSTVGALYMLAKENRLNITHRIQKPLQVKTACGVLKMEALIDEAGEIQVTYETPVIDLQATSISHSMVANAMGIDLEIIQSDFPVMYEKTNQDLFVVVRSLSDFREIECDFRSLASFCRQHHIVVLCLLTPNAFDQNYQFHMRCFAPMVGIQEDPFTGSVLGGLTAYVDQNKLLPSKTTQYYVEQGHFLERAGFVKVEFKKEQGKYKVKVFAQAVHCFSTEIHLT